MVGVNNEQSVSEIKAMIRDYRSNLKKEWDAMRRTAPPVKQEYQRRYRKNR